MHRSIASIGASMAVVLLLTVSARAQIAPAGSGVTMSPHNLNTFGVAVENQEVCRPCHTPHNANVTDGPLWNHEINWGATYKLFGIEHNTSFKANYVGLDEGSRLCLSCHDGAIAVDNYGGKTTGTKFITGDKAVGRNGDLSDDHPVGMIYPGVTGKNADGTYKYASAGPYNDPNGTEFTNKGDGRGISLVELPGTDNWGIGCSTCHGAHGNTKGNFLRVSNTYSFICKRCHTF